MRRGLLLLVIGLSLGGCGPSRHRKPPVEEMPAWRTDEGRDAVRLEIIASLLDSRAPGEALQLIRTLRDEGYDEPVLDLYQAEALYIQGVYSEAERLLVEYQRKHPRDPRSYRTLGLVYADRHELDQAIDTFVRAVELDDKDAQTWNNLGFLYTTQGRYDEAVEALQEAVSLDGTQVRYRNNLGFALAGTGAFGRALEVFLSAGQPADAYSNLALSYEMAGDTETALTHYRKALEYDPRHPESNDGVTRLEEPEEDP